jgi:hypothetical protein
LNFDVTLGTDYLCPRCWVAQGVTSTRRRPDRAARCR